MSSQPLFHPPLMAQLIVDGLNRYHDRPCLYLGDTIASYREVRERTSQFIQALASKGVGRGSHVAVLSATTNRKPPASTKAVSAWTSTVWSAVSMRPKTKASTVATSGSELSHVTFG